MGYKAKKKTAPKGSSQIAESSRASTATTSRHASIETEEEESHYGDNAEIIEVDHSGNETEFLKPQDQL